MATKNDLRSWQLRCARYAQGRWWEHLWRQIETTAHQNFAFTCAECGHTRTYSVTAGSN
jgi:hypothetical protein